MLITQVVDASIPVKYASPLGNARWSVSGNPLRCGLSITIPDYGIAYFEQYATKSPHFILRKWEEVQGYIPATVWASSPVWKPYGRSFLVKRSKIKPGKWGIYLDRQPSLKLLTYLNNGYKAQFKYRSEQGFPVTVELSPVRFREVYGRYQRCLGALFDFDYDDVKENTIYFGLDNYELAEEDKKQLRRIAEYVRVDHQIKSINIAGYTDDQGRKGYNNAVSQKRAEMVSNYLLSVGVPKYKLDVTWYGVKDPVAPNNTMEGRAKNRRVVVELEHK